MWSTTSLPEFVNRDVVFFRHQIKDPACLYDLQQGEIIQKLPSGARAVSPDLRYCAVDIDHGMAEIWHINENRLVVSGIGNGQNFIFPDSEHVVVRQNYDRFVTRHIESSEIVSDFALVGHTYHQPQISQQFLTTVAASGWVRRYDLYTGQALVDFIHTPGWIYAVKVAGRYLAIHAHYTVSIFDLTTAQIIWQKPTRTMQDTNTFQPHMVLDVALHGTWVTVQSETEVEIWDFIEDRLIASCPGYLFYGELALPYLYFTGRNSAQASRLIKFDVEKQSIVAEIDAPEESYMALTEENGLLMGWLRGEVKQLDVETLSEIRIIAGTTDRDRNFKAVSREFFATIEGNEMKLISLRDGHIQHSIPVPPQTIIASISADAKTIVTTNENERNTIHFWRLMDSVIPVYSITHSAIFWTATFADDRTLVTSHTDGTVNFWDITHITQGLV